MDELTLPPLPEFPEGTVEVDCGPLTGGGRAISIEDGYSADQMRAYAQQAASAAVLQERERCAKLCDLRANILRDDSDYFLGYRDSGKNCAAAIRTAPKES